MAWCSKVEGQARSQWTRGLSGGLLPEAALPLRANGRTRAPGKKAVMGPVQLKMPGTGPGARLGTTGALRAEAVVPTAEVSLIGMTGKIRWRAMTPATGFMTADPAAVVPSHEAVRVAVARAGAEVLQGPQGVAGVAGKPGPRMTSCIHRWRGARWAHYR